MIYRVIAILIFGSAASLMFMVQLTSPSALSPFGILFFFILLYALVLGVLTLFLFFANILVNKLRKKFSLGRPASLSMRRSYFYASVLAFAPVVLIAMQSVSEIGLLDIALVVLFETIACFYVWRRS